ncbi:Ankyrin-3 [Lachnellula suecica]|uniref:Ankyrin-3 n=1 Tax=Lachnellula suecica TaxID=602035 RepID=A0A8T9C9K1_9HELO|nr:Ankyrin-3 [Lachnellula suecica]
MTFHYDYSKTDGTGKGFSESGIRDVASQLLDGLSRERIAIEVFNGAFFCKMPMLTTKRNKSDRSFSLRMNWEEPWSNSSGIELPLTGHQALLLAKNDKRYQSIEYRTCQLCFFGTPHRARNYAEWEETLLNIAITLPQTSQYQRSQLIKSLVPKIRDISIQFISLLGMYGVINVFEEGTPEMPAVVDQYIATFSIASENVIAQPCGLSDLCKISSAYDNRLKAVGPNWSHFEDDFRDCRRMLWDLSPPLKLPGECMGDFEWLKANSTYKSWAESEKSSVLLLHGPQELGELTTSLLLLQHLADEETWRNSSICYFSFDSEDGRKCSADSLVASLAFQMLSMSPETFRHSENKEAYRLLNENPKWTKRKLGALLRSLLKNRVMSYYIVDGVHKCDDSLKSFLLDLNALLQLEPEEELGFKFVFIGEAIPEAFGSLTSYQEIYIPRVSNLEADVTKLVDQLIASRPVLKSAEKELCALFSDNTDTLWTTLIVEHLKSTNLRSTYSSICDYLERLPRTSTQYLDNTLLNIPEWADETLSWVIHALRPLTLNELAVAISLDGFSQTQESLHQAMPKDIAQDLKDTFGSLLKVDDYEVRISHPSIVDLLRKRDTSDAERISRFSINKNWDITERCLAFLSMDTFHNLEFLQDSALLPDDKSLAFLEYAVRYWPDHYRMSPKDDECRKRILDFLRNEAVMDTWIELDWRLKPPSIRRRFQNSPILIASSLGLSDIVAVLQDEGADDITTSERGQALHLAASNEYHEVVEILLEHPINESDLVEALSDASERENDALVEIIAGSLSKIQKKLDIPPVCLRRAAEINNLALAQILLTAGANVDSVFKGLTPLQIASKQGHTAFVEYLLQHNASMDQTDSAGRTPLVFAIYHDHSDTVSKLVTSGASLNKQNANAVAPLHLAIKKGQLETVKMLLEAGADAHTISGSMQNPALHFACRNGNVGILNMLREEKVDVNRGNKHGFTALMIAVDCGHDECVQLLIAHKASLNKSNDCGETALYKAVSKAYQSITEILLLAGANPNISGVPVRPLDAFAAAEKVATRLDDEGPPPPEKSTPLTRAITLGFPIDLIKLLVEKGADVNAEDEHGRLALHHAAILGNEDVLRILLENGAEVDCTDTFRHSRTALHYATKFQKETAVQVLLEYKAAVNTLDAKDRTALHLAAKGVRERIVELLLEKDADPKLADKEGNTPLHLAVITLFGGSILAIELLLSKSNVNAIDNDGATALHHAAKHGEEGAVPFLLEKGADLEILDKAKRSVLHYAAQNGSTAILESLVREDTDLEAADEDGETALYIAAYYSRSDAVRLLLDKGASPNCKNNNNQTPIYQAVWEGELDMVKLFRDRGAALDVVESNFGYTLLHRACSEGREEIVRYLLKSGHSVEVLDEDGWTPLHVAALNGYVEVMELLHESHANLFARAEDGRSALHFAFRKMKAAKWLLAHHVDVDSCDNGDATPLMSAVSDGLRQLVELFLRAGADPNRADSEGKHSLHCMFDNRWPSRTNQETRTRAIARLLIDAGADVNKLDNESRSVVGKAVKKGNETALQMFLDACASLASKNEALMVAIIEDSKEMVATLLAAGANSSTRDETGLTSALILAIKEGREKIAIYLVENGADLSVDGPVALHDASFDGQEDLVHRLLAKDVDVNVRPLGWNTALQAAMIGNNIKVTEDLLENGADINTAGGEAGYPLGTAILNFPGAVPLILDKGAKVENIDKQGRVALHLAAQTGRFPIFQRISAVPEASIDVKDKQGRNVLHHAAIGGSDVMIKFLLDGFDFDINAADDDGWTALHWACRNQNPMVVQTLLDGGADYKKACTRGWTPLYIALFHNQDEVVQVLDEWKKNRAPADNTKETLIEAGETNPFTCDSCASDVIGLLFVCKTCTNFGYCFKCHWTAEKTDPGHEFERRGEGPDEGPKFNFLIF